MARRRRRSSKFKLSVPSIMDVGIANIAVRVAPDLINRFVPVPAGMQSIAGAGAGFLVGHFLKKPLVQNAAIATAAVDFVVPIIEDMLGTNSGVPITNTTKMMGVKTAQNMNAMADFQRLEEYTNDPSQRMGYNQYMHFYN